MAAKTEGPNITIIAVAIILVVGVLGGIYLITSSVNHAQTTTLTTISASTTVPTTSILTTTVLKASQFIITNCNAVPGFGACYNPTSISASGNLTLTLFQTVGSNLYNIALACAQTSASSGLPNPNSAMVYLNSRGNTTSITTPTAPPNPPENLLNGQANEITATGLKCFGVNGNPLSVSSFTPGTAFSVGIWINYTLSSGAIGASNPVLTQKFDIINMTTG